MKLKEDELISVCGGATKNWKAPILLGIGGLIILITGIIDGYMNPDKCRS